MGVLEDLTLDVTWDNFLQYKIEKRHFAECEQREWTAFIKERKYREITDKLLEENNTFDFPVKKIVNKKGTLKKRTVYSYKPDEVKVLKVMSYLLYRYDDKISRCCYSFRQNVSAKSAIHKILSIQDIQTMYCFKADISNYFNSIPGERLCGVVREVIDDDDRLAAFLERLLLADMAYSNGRMVQEKRGAMAGIPISPFFANIYLRSLDLHFEKEGIPYFRYSDDILLLTGDEKELGRHSDYIKTYLTQNGLALNQEKVEIYKPGERIDFLGISYYDGKIDLSSITKDKLKAKIKRKAHALYRWKRSKNVDYDKTARVMIRIFNKKFYDDKDENNFTWSRWFFPVLTCDEGLKEMDAYLLSYIRYIYKGRHYKGNYRIKYEDIKEMGYRSLVNEYYKFTERYDDKRKPCIKS